MTALIVSGCVALYFGIGLAYLWIHVRLNGPCNPMDPMERPMTIFMWPGMAIGLLAAKPAAFISKRVSSLLDKVEVSAAQKHWKSKQE